MVQYPCRYCTDDRHPGYHDRCERYLKVKQRNDAVKEAKRKDRDINDYIVGTIKKNQDHDSKCRRSNRHHVR